MAKRVINIGNTEQELVVNIMGKDSEEELASKDQQLDFLKKEIHHLMKFLEDKEGTSIEQFRECLQELLEESAPSPKDCPNSDQCFMGGEAGRGAYLTPEENAAGGSWFRECHCMSEAQQKAAELLEKTKSK